MKQKIIIKRINGLIYQGKIINVPMKKSHIIEKCIELFDDDDPCIIHSSYAQKYYAEALGDLLNKLGESPLYVKDYLDELSFIDYENLEELTITVK